MKFRDDISTQRTLTPRAPNKDNVAGTLIFGTTVLCKCFPFGWGECVALNSSILRQAKINKANGKTLGCVYCVGSSSYASWRTINDVTGSRRDRNDAYMRHPVPAARKRVELHRNYNINGRSLSDTRRDHTSISLKKKLQNTVY